MNTAVEGKIQESNLQSAMGTTEKKALDLLGAGWGAELVAQTLGVSAGRISQLLSNPEFANQVQERRFHDLQKHSEHDARIDRIEHKVAENLEKTIPFLMKPQDQLRALQMLNGLRRRGSTGPTSEQQAAETVVLLMPTVITQKFTTNINNQVINAGGQILETIQSGTLMRQAKEQIIQQQQKLIENIGVERTPHELTRYQDVDEGRITREERIRQQVNTIEGISSDDL